MYLHVKQSDKMVLIIMYRSRTWWIVLMNASQVIFTSFIDAKETDLIPKRN